MGNKLGRRRQVVDEKYTKPQGSYHIKDVDIKKLRKLILESKLAPCFPGDEECDYECEECPICFLYYPSLNRSRCCMKGICTECFLQMKTPGSAHPTQCPFCKTLNYAVEYRGVKTKEEKGLEQLEEQRVIEAKIRMRQQELQDEEERMQKRQEINSSTPMEAAHSSVAVPSSRSPIEGGEIVSSQDSSDATIIRQSPTSRPHRDDEFDLDLEDIMVMEAIWLSIQENGRHKNPVYGSPAPSEQYVAERHVSTAMAPLAGSSSSSSPSGGLACAIAALAERQQMSGEFSVNRHMSSVNMLPGSNRFHNRAEQGAESYPSAESTTVASPDGRMVVTTDDGEWGVDRVSEVAEAGTSYAGSDVTEDGGGISAVPPQDEIEGSFQNGMQPIVPESFEEQMMLAMAVSLAEARDMTSEPGAAWQ